MAVPAPISRRRALGGLGALAVAAAGCAPTLTPAQRETARAIRDTSPSVIAKVMGGNFIRVFTEVTRS